MARGLKKRRQRTIERDVTIDGYKLRWELRSEPQWSTEHGHEGLSIRVERVDGSFRELILQYPIVTYMWRGELRPGGYPQRPKISDKTVEADIRLALDRGWNPSSRGKAFVFQVPEYSN
jgi:hypothetical protein